MRFLFKKTGFTRMQLSKNSLRNPHAGWIQDVQFMLAQLAANTPSGADRNRTDDLRLARAALSHLSYSPGRYTSDHLDPLSGTG